ncbi:MAG TPA: biotin transporter BioY, partial [Candidatus Dormibacteraeota bacterium]|nr:biotin transporter BioY [Candidatus Dormibacteraeota bacterium]
MNEVIARPQVLADRVPGTLLRDAALITGYATLVGLLAQLTILLPFTPIPITGQTFGVLIGGMALGWRRAILGMAAYVGLGLVGLPWFAGGNGGPTIVHAPSFGYLIGFVAAAALLGRLAELGADRNPAVTLGCMILGSAVIYVFGVTWLAIAIQVNLETA